MKADIKDIAKWMLDKIHPTSINRDLVHIRNELLSIVSDAQATISDYPTNLIIEDKAIHKFSCDANTKAEYELLLNKMFRAIIMTEDYENGIFCKLSCPSWQHIQTAYILHIFSNINMTVAQWDNNRSVEIILNSLVQNQNTDGSWGEDFYDSCVTLSALLKFKDQVIVRGYDDAIRKSLNHITNIIDLNFAIQENNEWYGGGFYGVAIYLFSCHKETITQSAI